MKGHADCAGNIIADNLARSCSNEKSAIICATTTAKTILQKQSDEVEQLKLKIRRDKLMNDVVENDIVYFIDHKLPDSCQRRAFIPTFERRNLLKIAHDDPLYGGHLGIKKSYRKWWPGIYNDVENYVKSCETCQAFKNTPGLPKRYLHSIPVSSSFEHLHIDLVGPLLLSYNGIMSIITVTDAFSKYLYAEAISTLTSDIIEFVCCCHLKKISSLFMEYPRQ